MKRFTVIATATLLIACILTACAGNAFDGFGEEEGGRRIIIIPRISSCKKDGNVSCGDEQEVCQQDTECCSGLCNVGKCQGCDEVGTTCADNPSGIHCQSNSCKKVMDEWRCQEATCIDSIRNRTETDLDCGGEICDPCGSHERCKINSDCLSKNCVPHGMLGFKWCLSPQCNDSIQNGKEWDVDCGGDSECGACPNGSCEFYWQCHSKVCENKVCK